MSWSTEFVEELAQASEAYRPLFRFESIEPPEQVGRGNWVASSREGDEFALIVGGRVTGTELTPKQWTSQTGSWEVTLTGDIRQILGRMWRGQPVRLTVGFPGWDVGRYQPVAVGTIWNIRGRPDRFTVQCRDAFSLLGSRITKTSGEYSLFHDIGTTTTKSNPTYVPGASSITVGSTTGFQRQDDGSGTLTGCIKLTPSSADPFFLTYTGTTVTTFTGLSATGQFGTVASNVGNGNLITECALIDDTPIDAMLRILVSDGSFESTGFNTLPASWGFGLPDVAVDFLDAQRWNPYVTPASGGTDFDFVFESPLIDPLSTLQELLAGIGFFLVVHQGQISIRPVTDPSVGLGSAQNTSVNFSTVRITNEDILPISEGGIEWEAWDSSYGVEHQQARVLTASGTLSVSEPISGLPAEQTIDYNTGTEPPTLINDNQATQRTLLLTRLKPWALRVPERLMLRCGGLRLAQLAPGDIVEIETGVIGGRLDSTREGYEGRRAMVTAVSPNWFGISTDVQLSIVPDKTDDFD